MQDHTGTVLYATPCLRPLIFAASNYLVDRGGFVPIIRKLRSTDGVIRWPTSFRS